MTLNGYFVAVALVSMINGLLSPARLIVLLLAPVWLPDFVPARAETLQYGSSLIVATSTLLISGVPAAFYERLRGRQTSDAASMLIWLAGAILLTLPGLMLLL